MKRQWEQEPFGGQSPNRTLLPAEQRSRSSLLVGHDKRVFYEHLTDVKVCSFVFLHGAFAFVVGLVAPQVALHRVSIRALGELT